MSTQKLFKPFADKYRKKAKATSKNTIINDLIKDYYATTLEEALHQPKHFGEESAQAEEDPRGLATRYTADFRSALIKKDRLTLEYLFIHMLEDQDNESQV